MCRLGDNQSVMVGTVDNKLVDGGCVLDDQAPVGPAAGSPKSAAQIGQASERALASQGEALGDIGRATRSDREACQSSAGAGHRDAGPLLTAFTGKGVDRAAGLALLTQQPEQPARPIHVNVRPQGVSQADFNKALKMMGTREGAELLTTEKMIVAGPSAFSDRAADLEPNFTKHVMHKILLWVIFGLSDGNKLIKHSSRITPPQNEFSTGDWMNMVEAQKAKGDPLQMGDSIFFGRGELAGHASIYLGDVADLKRNIDEMYKDEPQKGAQIWTDIKTQLFGDQNPFHLPANDPRRQVIQHSLATAVGNRPLPARFTKDVINEVFQDSDRIGVIFDTIGDYFQSNPRNNVIVRREYFMEADVSKAPEHMQALLSSKSEDERAAVRKAYFEGTVRMEGLPYDFSLVTGDAGGRYDKVHCSELLTRAAQGALQSTGLPAPDYYTTATDNFIGSPRTWIGRRLLGLIDFDTIIDRPEEQAVSRTGRTLFANGMGEAFLKDYDAKFIRPEYKHVYLERTEG